MLPVHLAKHKENYFLNDYGYCQFVTVFIMQYFIVFDIIVVVLSCVDMVYSCIESRSFSKVTTSTETDIPLYSPSISGSTKGWLLR